MDGGLYLSDELEQKLGDLPMVSFNEFILSCKKNGVDLKTICSLLNDLYKLSNEEIIGLLYNMIELNFEESTKEIFEEKNKGNKEYILEEEYLELYNYIDSIAESNKTGDYRESVNTFHMIRGSEIFRYKKQMPSIRSNRHPQELLNALKSLSTSPVHPKNINLSISKPFKNHYMMKNKIKIIFGIDDIKKFSDDFNEFVKIFNIKPSWLKWVFKDGIIYFVNYEKLDPSELKPIN